MLFRDKEKAIGCWMSSLESAWARKVTSYQFVIIRVYEGMRLGELTYRVTHFYLGIVEARGQLHAPADLSPSEEPLVPTEKKTGWEMNTP
jgi:hypothetical protein